MKAPRNLVSLCQTVLASIGLAAGITLTGCGSDTGTSPHPLPSKLMNQQTLP